MSDLLEKVARRIWRIKHPDCRDQQWEDSGWANETDEARAAIAAVLDDLDHKDHVFFEATLGLTSEETRNAAHWIDRYLTAKRKEMGL